MDMGDVVFVFFFFFFFFVFFFTIARSAENEHGNGRDIDFSVDGNEPLSSLCSGKLRTYDTVQVVGSI